MTSNSVYETSETAPLKPSDSLQPSLTVQSAGRVFGSTFFLISALLASIIPIIELVIGSYYSGRCPIDERIPTYMIVAGSCGLVLVALAVILAVTFLCFISDSAAISAVGTVAIVINIAVSILLAVFLFIWFIFGCVWVFSIASEVDFRQKLSPYYCDPVLYQWTFALIIVTFMWAFIQCCLSCFRTCCIGRGF